MKLRRLLNMYFLLIYTLLISLIPLFAVENQKLQEILSIESSLQSEADVYDSDDMIMKMKSFFDNYANKLKNSIKDVDKIILPFDGVNQKIEYVSNFSIDDLNRKTNKFIEDNTSIRQKDLKFTRDSKQIVEENYIDQITKNKILNSRINLSNGDKNKIVNDFNEKNNIKISTETEIKDSENKLENISSDQLKKLKNLKENLIQYENKIKNLQLNEKVFENELGVQNNLEKLKYDNFKADFETEFFTNKNLTIFEFSNKADDLEQIFKKGLQCLHKKIMPTQNSIQNITEKRKNIKKEIDNKYSVYENLNSTINKLKTIQSEYTNTLRKSEEELNLLKSKKKIIEDNINEKKKVRKIRKGTIENVLHNSEKELEKFNVDKINVNRYRRDLTGINNRLKNLLIKENMIFKKNKIKI